MKTAWLFAACVLLACFPAMAQQSGQGGPQNAADRLPNTQAASTDQTLTLAEVVRLALEHSPSLALARVQYTVAKNTTGEDRSAFRPNLYTGSGAAYTNGFPETPGGAAPAVFQMSYTQAIFNPLARGAVHADEQFAKNKELDYENARDNLIVGAASAYLELADVQQSLKLLTSDRDSSQQIVDLTQQREAAGLELPAAVTESELQATRIAQRIVQYQDREEVLSEQIRDMTGLPPGEPLRLASDETLASESLEPASNILTEVTDHSAALREAENYRIARQELLKGARGSYWPTVDIVGEYSVLSRINNYDDFFKRFQRNNVNVGVQVTIPIFAAKTSADVALAKSNFDEANLELQEQKRAVQEGAEQKVRVLKEANAAREVARLDLQLAQQQLQGVEAKFNQGHVTLGELEQARVLENEKWMAFLDAGLYRERAQLALLQATGELAKVFH